MKKNSVTISPIITEKAIRESSLGRFTFKVNLAAKKPEIKKVVEEEFKVKVVAITTSILKGRKKSGGKKRASVKQGPSKKAIVKLLTGQKIEIFTGLENEQKT